MTQGSVLVTGGNRGIGKAIAAYERRIAFAPTQVSNMNSQRRVPGRSASGNGPALLISSAW